MLTFGAYVREQREALRAVDASYSLRQVAARMGVQPSFLSKVERGQDSPPSEPKIRLLAEILGENPDVLLAMAGKVSSDLQEAIRRRPKLFAELIRSLKDAPDPIIEKLGKEVRDGSW